MKTIKHIIIFTLLLAQSTFGMLTLEENKLLINKNSLTTFVTISNNSNDIYAGELVVFKLSYKDNIETESKIPSEKFIISEPLILLQPKEIKNVSIQYIGETDNIVEDRYSVSLESVPLMAIPVGGTPKNEKSSGRGFELSILFDYGTVIRIIPEEKPIAYSITHKLEKQKLAISLNNKSQTFSLKKKKLVIKNKNKKILEYPLTGNLYPETSLKINILLDKENYLEKDIIVQLK